MTRNKLKPSPEELCRMVEARARQYLIDFSIATNPKYRPNWHHELIAQELENLETADYQILMLFMPPRHGKSEEATINYPAWYLGNHPDKEIITVSYSAELAQDFGTKTRRLVAGEAYQKIFGLQLMADEQAKAKWRTEKGGSYTSVGIGGAITGRGANRLIIDDPIKNREDAESEVYRNKVWDFFISTAYTRLEPNGKVVLILTRWHLDDLAGRILNNEELKKKVKIIRFPAIAEEDEEYRKVGEALWPARYALRELESIKRASGTYEWSALYQQAPIATEAQEFKQTWFRYRTMEEVDRLYTRNFLTIDTAISERASADYTGFCLNYVDRENFWNLKAFRMRLNPKDLIDMIFSLHDQNGFEKIGIEKTIYLDVFKYLLDEEMRKRNRFLSIVELEHKQTAKELRIRGLIPRYESKSIYHIEAKDLEEELLTFPKGIHDDVADAAAYQLQIAEAPLGYDYEVQLAQNRRSYGYSANR